MATREGYTQTEAGRPEYGLVRELVFPCECLDVTARVGLEIKGTVTAAVFSVHQGHSRLVC